jgi:hypothetical protein
VNNNAIIGTEIVSFSSTKIFPQKRKYLLNFYDVKEFLSHTVCGSCGEKVSPSSVCLNNNKYTVKRPKFGNGPLVRHPLSILLKNHISARTVVSNLVQRGKWLYIFFWTNKKINNWGSPLILYGFQQLGHGMSKLGFEK